MALSQEDAEKVAQIICMADGGCPHCVEDSYKYAQQLWPEVDWKTLVYGEQNVADRQKQTN